MKQLSLLFICSLSISLLFAQSDLQLKFDSPASQFTHNLFRSGMGDWARWFLAGRKNKEAQELLQKYFVCAPQR